MPTTTIRVDRETHERLVELSKASGRSLIDTVSEAAEALRRKRLAEQVRSQLDTLRSDPEAWLDYLAEGEATHVTDGLD